jgi:hypothetical protein
MNKKDVIILQNSAITVVDNLVSTFDNSFNNGIPLLATVWGLSKGLYGASIQLRQTGPLNF